MITETEWRHAATAESIRRARASNRAVEDVSAAVTATERPAGDTEAIIETVDDELNEVSREVEQAHTTPVTEALPIPPARGNGSTPEQEAV